MQITNPTDRIAARLETKRLRRPWNADLHPRDSKGRFVETGGIARLWGGGMARVLRATGGRNVLVENVGTGERSTIHASRLTMVARPDGTAPTRSKRKVRDEDERRTADARRGRGVTSPITDEDQDDDDSGDQGETPDDPHDQDDEGNDIGDDVEGEDLGADGEPDDDDPILRDLSQATALPMNGGEPDEQHVRGNGNALRGASPGKKFEQRYRFTDAGHARVALRELHEDYVEDLLASVPKHWRNERAQNLVELLRDELPIDALSTVPKNKAGTADLADSLSGWSETADDLYRIAKRDPDSGDVARYASNLSDALHLASIRMELHKNKLLKEPKEYGHHPRAYRRVDTPEQPQKPKAAARRRRNPDRRFKSLDDVRSHWDSGDAAPHTANEEEQRRHNEALVGMFEKLEKPQLSRNGHFVIAQMTLERDGKRETGWAVILTDSGVRLTLSPRKAEAAEFAKRLEAGQVAGEPFDWNASDYKSRLNTPEGQEMVRAAAAEARAAFADRAAKKREGANARRVPAQPTPSVQQQVVDRSGVPAANVAAGHIGSRPAPAQDSAEERQAPQSLAPVPSGVPENAAGSPAPQVGGSSGEDEGQSQRSEGAEPQGRDWSQVSREELDAAYRKAVKEEADGEYDDDDAKATAASAEAEAILAEAQKRDSEEHAAQLERISLGRPDDMGHRPVAIDGDDERSASLRGSAGHWKWNRSGHGTRYSSDETFLTREAALANLVRERDEERSAASEPDPVEPQPDTDGPTSDDMSENADSLVAAALELANQQLMPVLGDLRSLHGGDAVAELALRAGEAVEQHEQGELSSSDAVAAFQAAVDDIQRATRGLPVGRDTSYIQKLLRLAHENVGVARAALADQRKKDKNRGVRGSGANVLADVPAGRGGENGQHRAGGVRAGQGSGDRGGNQRAGGRAGSADEGGNRPQGARRATEDGPVRGSGVSPARPGVRDGEGAGDGGEGHASGLPAAAGRVSFGSPEQEAVAPSFEPPADGAPLAPSSPLNRVKANIAAIEILHRLENEQRPATAEEQKELARWSGWGATPQVFKPKPDEKFAPLQKKLQELLTEEEWREARANTKNAHYTDPRIVQQIWDAVGNLGFDGGDVLEPGSGSGNFIGYAPEAARMMGVELDPITARISKALYPHSDIRHESFGDTRAPNATFDLAIGNVPFGRYKVPDLIHNKGNHSVHNHFILKSLELTRPGGLVAMVTSSLTMDGHGQNAESARMEMASKAELVGAIRLPSGAHQRTAGTGVVTDLLIFRRRERDKNFTSGRTRTKEIKARSERGQNDPPMWVHSLPRFGLPGQLDPQKDETATPVHYNSYFHDRPEQILGELSVGHGMNRADELRVDGNGTDPIAALRTALKRTVAEAQAAGLGYQAPPEGRKRVVLLPPGSSRVDGHVQAEPDGTFTQVRDGMVHPFPVPKTQADEARQLLAIRDTYQSLLAEESRKDADESLIERMRGALNEQYETYAKKYGAINRFEWAKTTVTDPLTGEKVQKKYRKKAPRGGLFAKDPTMSASVSSLDDYDDITDTTTRAAIFEKRQGTYREIAERADAPQDALAIVLEQHGDLTPEALADVMGTDAEDATARLLAASSVDPDTGVSYPLAFQRPDGSLVPAADYLSGNVREKLADARRAVVDDERFQVNVDHLERVIPPDLSTGEIAAPMGASWIGREPVQQFLRETLNSDQITVSWQGGALWAVDAPDSIKKQIAFRTRDTWSGKGYDALKLAEAILTNKKIRVTVETRDGLIFDQQATDDAIARADQLKEAFTDWLWADPDRAERFKRHYNDTFNSMAPRSYDGQRRTMPGLVEWFKPHGHQHSAVSRMVNEPAVLLAHEVGAGKTAEMTMGVMELRRLGLIKKAAIVVPGHMLDQFTTEFAELYPESVANNRILTAGSDDLSGNGRREFIARAASGDYDAVIMTQTAFESIQMRHDVQERYIQRQLDALEEKIRRQKEIDGEDNDTRLVKRMETQLANRRTKLAKKLSGLKDAAGLHFEDMGIDYLVVDEAHMYKNLYTASSIDSAAIEGSNRASDLDMKLEYLREHTGSGRVVTFATATPVANSITEVHTMMRYLRPDLLRQLGIEDFDDFASAFGQMVSAIERAADGSYSEKTRLAAFQNVPELMRIWRAFADVKNSEDLDLPVPDVAGGKAVTITMPMSEAQEEYEEQIKHRAAQLAAGGVDPRDDNYLKLMSDGRASALDPRLLDPELGAGNKLPTVADNITRIHEQTKDVVYPSSKTDSTPHPTPGGLQIVFLDLGTPKDPGKTKKRKKNAGEEDGAEPGDGSGKEAAVNNFSTYDELKSLLIARGVPSDKIRYIHEAKDDAAKARLFHEARTGKIAVLIGSTQKMGTGTNVQLRATAMHHVDAPWRPADVEQRNGRVIRQGNSNNEVAIFQYATERSTDAKFWEAIARKARFIRQLMRGSLTERVVEDIGEIKFDADESAALIAGDPHLIAQASLRPIVKRLRSRANAHQRSQEGFRKSIRDAELAETRTDALVSELEDVLQKRKKTRGADFNARIGTTDYEGSEGRSEARDALNKAARAVLKRGPQGLSGDDPQPEVIGQLGGLDITAVYEQRWDFYISSYVRGVTLEIPAIPDSGRLYQDHHLVDMDGKPQQLPLMRLEDSVAGIEAQIRRAQDDLSDKKRAADQALTRVGKSFDLAEDLAKAEQQLAILDQIMRLKAKSGGDPKERAAELQGLDQELRELIGEEEDVLAQVSARDLDLNPRTPAPPAVTTDKEGRTRFVWPDAEARNAARAKVRAKKREAAQARQRERDEAAPPVVDALTMTEADLTEETDRLGQLIANDEASEADVLRHAGLTREQTRRAKRKASGQPKGEPSGERAPRVSGEAQAPAAEGSEAPQHQEEQERPGTNTPSTSPVPGQAPVAEAEESDDAAESSEGTVKLDPAKVRSDLEGLQQTSEPVREETGSAETTVEPGETPPASQTTDAPAGAPDVELPKGQRWVHRDDVRPGDVVRFYRDGKFRDVAALIKNTRAPHHLDFADVDRRSEFLGDWKFRGDWVAVVDKGPDRTAGNRYIKHYGEYMRNQLAENLQRWEADRRGGETEETTPGAAETPEAGRDETSSDDEQQSTNAEPETQKDDAQADTQAPSGAAPSSGQRATDSDASPSRAPRARTSEDDGTNESGAPRAQRPVGERTPRPAPMARPEPESQPAPADMTTEQLGDAIDDVEDQLSPLTESTNPLDLAMRRRLELRLWELENEERQRWTPEQEYDEKGNPVERSRGSIIQDRLGGYGLNSAETEGLVTRVEDLPDAKPGGYSDDEWERIDAAAAANEAYPPTGEQQIIIDGAARRGLNMAVMALAGTGKSSTLKMLSHRMPGKRIVYLAFNKSVAQEARESQARGEYAKNLVASTANAYAARAVDKRYNQRLPRNGQGGFKKLNAQQIADRMHWFDTVQVGGRDLSPGGAAAVAERMIRAWAKSSDEEMGPQHVPGGTENERRDLFDAVKPLADRMWSNLTDPDRQDADEDLTMDFDYIVKMWAQAGYKLDADTLFWDEAQDVNPVLEGVVKGALAQGVQVVAVGDSNQAIYGFRGTSNALGTLPVDARATLTQSFRFGPEVAGVGNKFLRLLGSRMRLKGFDQKDSNLGTLEPGDETMVIARTNAGVALAAVQALTAGRTVAVSGGLKFLQDFVRGARALQNGENTDHADLARFNGMPYDDILEEVQGDPDLKQLDSFFTLLKKHGNDIDTLLASGARIAETEVVGGRVWVKPDWDAPEANDLKQWLGDGKNNGVGKLLYDPATKRYYYEPGKKDVPWRNARTGRGGVHKVDNKLSLEEAQQAIEAHLATLMPDEEEETTGGRLVPETQQHDVLVTTAHKSKGLESERVRIADDFRGPKDKDDGTIDWDTIPDDEGLRVAYVAVTRATDVLDPGSLGWVFRAVRGDDPIEPPKGDYRRDFTLDEFSAGDEVDFQEEDGTPNIGVVDRIEGNSLMVRAEGDFGTQYHRIGAVQVQRRNGAGRPRLHIASDRELDAALANGDLDLPGSGDLQSTAPEAPAPQSESTRTPDAPKPPAPSTTAESPTIPDSATDSNSAEVSGLFAGSKDDNRRALAALRKAFSDQFPEGVPGQVARLSEDAFAFLGQQWSEAVEDRFSANSHTALELAENLGNYEAGQGRQGTHFAELNRAVVTALRERRDRLRDQEDPSGGGAAPTREAEEGLVAGNEVPPGPNATAEEVMRYRRRFALRYKVGMFVEYRDDNGEIAVARVAKSHTSLLVDESGREFVASASWAEHHFIAVREDDGSALPVPAWVDALPAGHRAVSPDEVQPGAVINDRLPGGELGVARLVIGTEDMNGTTMIHTGGLRGPAGVSIGFDPRQLVVLDETDESRQLAQAALRRADVKDAAKRLGVPLPKKLPAPAPGKSPAASPPSAERPKPDAPTKPYATKAEWRDGLAPVDSAETRLHRAAIITWGSNDLPGSVDLIRRGVLDAVAAMEDDDPDSAEADLTRARESAAILLDTLADDERGEMAGPLGEFLGALDAYLVRHRETRAKWQSEDSEARRLDSEGRAEMEREARARRDAVNPPPKAPSDSGEASSNPEPDGDGESIDPSQARLDDYVRVETQNTAGNAVVREGYLLAPAKKVTATRDKERVQAWRLHLGAKPGEAPSRSNGVTILTDERVERLPAPAPAQPREEAQDQPSHTLRWKGPGESRETVGEHDGKPVEVGEPYVHKAEATFLRDEDRRAVYLDGKRIGYLLVQDEGVRPEHAVHGHIAGRWFRQPEDANPIHGAAMALARADDAPILSFPADRIGRAEPIRQWAGVWAQPLPDGVHNVYLDRAIAQNSEGWTAKAGPYDVKFWISTLADVEPLAQYDENARRSMEEVPQEGREFLAGLAADLRSSVQRMGEEFRADLRPMLRDHIATRGGRTMALELRHEMSKERVQQVRDRVREQIDRARAGAGEHGLSEQQAENFLLGVVGGDDAEQTSYGIRGEFPEALRPLGAAVSDSVAYWSAFAGWATQDDHSNWAGMHWENGRREEMGAPMAPFADARTGTGELIIGEAELPKGMRWARASELRQGDIFHAVRFPRNGTTDGFDGMDTPQYVIHTHRDGVEGAIRSVTLDSDNGSSDPQPDTHVVIVENPEPAVRKKARSRARTDMYMNWELPKDEDTYELGGPERVEELAARADVTAAEKDGAGIDKEWTVSVGGVDVGRIDNTNKDKPGEYTSETPDGERRVWHGQALATAALVLAYEEAADRGDHSEDRENGSSDDEQTGGSDGSADSSRNRRRGGRDGAAPDGANSGGGNGGSTPRSDAENDDEDGPESDDEEARRRRQRRRDRDNEGNRPGGGRPGAAGVPMPRIPSNDDDDRSGEGSNGDRNRSQEAQRLRDLTARYRSGEASVPQGADPESHVQYLRGLADNDSAILSPDGGIIAWTNTGATWRFGHAASGLLLEGWEADGELIGGREGARLLAGAYEKLRDGNGAPIDWHAAQLDADALRQWMTRDGDALSDAVSQVREAFIRSRQGGSNGAQSGPDGADGSGRQGANPGTGANSTGAGTRVGEVPGGGGNAGGERTGEAEPRRTTGGPSNRSEASSAPQTSTSQGEADSTPTSGNATGDGPGAAEESAPAGSAVAHGIVGDGAPFGDADFDLRSFFEPTGDENRNVVSDEGAVRRFGSADRMRDLASRATVLEQRLPASRGHEVWLDGRLIGTVHDLHEYNRELYPNEYVPLWQAEPNFFPTFREPNFRSREAGVAELVLRALKQGPPDLSVVSEEMAKEFRRNQESGFPKDVEGQNFSAADRERYEALGQLLRSLGEGRSPSGNVADDVAAVIDEAQWLNTLYVPEAKEDGPTPLEWMSRFMAKHLDSLRPEDPRAAHHSQRRLFAEKQALEDLLASGAVGRAQEMRVSGLRDGDVVQVSGHNAHRALTQGTGYLLGSPRKGTLRRGGEKIRVYRLTIRDTRSATGGPEKTITVPEDGKGLLIARAADVVIEDQDYGLRPGQNAPERHYDPAKDGIDRTAGRTDGAEGASSATTGSADGAPPAASTGTRSVDSSPSPTPAGTATPARQPTPVPTPRRSRQEAPSADETAEDAAAPESIGGRPAEWVKVSDLGPRDLVRIEGITRNGTPVTRAGYVTDGPKQIPGTRAHKVQDMYRVLVAETPDGKGDRGSVWVNLDATAARATREEPDQTEGAPQTGADSDVLTGRIPDRVPADRNGTGLYPGSLVTDGNGNEGVVTGAGANNVHVQFGDDRTDDSHSPGSLTVTDGGAARPSSWTPEGHRVRAGDVVGNRDGDLLGTVEAVDGDTATVATPQGMADMQIAELRVVGTTADPGDTNSKIATVQATTAGELKTGDVIVRDTPDGPRTARITSVQADGEFVALDLEDTADGSTMRINVPRGYETQRALATGGGAPDLLPEDRPGNREGITSHEPAQAVTPVTGHTVDPQLSREERDAITNRGEAPTDNPEAQQAAARIGNDLPVTPAQASALAEGLREGANTSDAQGRAAQRAANHLDAAAGNEPDSDGRPEPGTVGTVGVGDTIALPGDLDPETLGSYRVVGVQDVAGGARILTVEDRDGRRSKRTLGSADPLYQLPEAETPEGDGEPRNPNPAPDADKLREDYADSVVRAVIDSAIQGTATPGSTHELRHNIAAQLEPNALRAAMRRARDEAMAAITAAGVGEDDYQALVSSLRPEAARARTDAIRAALRTVNDLEPLDGESEGDTARRASDLLRLIPDALRNRPRPEPEDDAESAVDETVAGHADDAVGEALRAAAAGGELTDELRASIVAQLAARMAATRDETAQRIASNVPAGRSPGVLAHIVAGLVILARKVVALVAAFLKALAKAWRNSRGALRSLRERMARFRRGLVQRIKSWPEARRLRRLAAATDLGQLADGLSLADRVAHWAHLLPAPGRFGQVSRRARWYLPARRSTLAGGALPSVQDGVRWMPDRAVDGGPGPQALRHLAAVRAAGNDVDLDVAARLAADVPELGDDPHGAVRHAAAYAATASRRLRDLEAAAAGGSDGADLEVAAARVEAQSARQEADRLQRVYAAALPDAVRNTLVNLREMGPGASATLITTPESDPDAVRALTDVAQFIPRDWLSPTESRFLAAQGGDAGGYDPAGRIATVADLGDAGRRTAAHALLAHLQQHYPDLLAAQEAFHFARTHRGRTGARRQTPLDALLARLFGNRPAQESEDGIVPFGLATLFSGDWYEDDDLRAFLLGLLATR
ncbi:MULTISPECIES: UvrD-helicase domain-containing protein [unclassified Streptomyces]|uniref:UvrD-helicase domain-containing protein n=1 Tax=unclassified Streptomyces TaxID=2593676 RepID=UPI0035DA2626